ncbi:Glycoside hydrolase family 5 protein [Mycena indigotica]|uniref:glucan 1,3-beta-glucosidase n=1 Tax=Mycena indigotica TaxID=2126181 RepID=A0A8H6WJZ6_9AGAR|nr:Glycoside hydrolase family 5 protein [Mycena indigotica]KAF7315129.1 Glycoside hydrolase family 5 protein [Mycena indigotica]
MQEGDLFTTPSYAIPHSNVSSPQLAPQPYQAPSQRQGSSLDSYRDEPENVGYPPASPVASGLLLPGGAASQAGYSAYPGNPLPQNAYASRYNGADSPYVPGRASADQRRKRRLIGLAAVMGLIIVAAAVIIPVYFAVIKKNNSSKATSATSSNPSSGSPSSSGDPGGGEKPTSAITGSDGSTVLTADGTSFVYKNQFGGFWVDDPSNPFLNSAAPNSWTPPLNQSWTWGKDKVYGVNLGGWFVLEPYIAPALFQKYPSAADEWTLSTMMRADGTLESTMENHYDTFITEQDFAEIAGAGLNWVRIPIPFWAISTWADVGQDVTSATVSEPFLEAVCWKYIIRALNWARKYGLRVNLDLHTAPGSQNGYNHSGKQGQVNFLNGPMGVANAQRMLDYIRIVIEFVSQDEYKDLVLMVGIINEALLRTIGRDQLTSFYLQAHDMIRGITGYGTGNGPYISIHDGFDMSLWDGFLPGSDRIILDTHPYFAFNQQPNTAPIGLSSDPATAGGVWPKQACDSWGPGISASQTAFGVTVAGEFSNGYNDCGLYVTGVNGSQTYGGDCTLFLDSASWNASMKAGLMQFSLASMDATQNWFFWTWKIGAAANGIVGAPLWSYKLGLENGWIPPDPRKAIGVCTGLGAGQAEPFDGTYSAWQTGGAGAGTIAPSASAKFGTWPPVSIANVEAASLKAMPTYTPTASITTLTYATPTAKVAVPSPSIGLGNGWKNAGDKTPAMTAVAGCVYPNAWGALTLQAPAALSSCTGA